MPQHYFKKDENGTELLLQTHPGGGHIRIVLLPKDGRGRGVVYFMPWEDQLWFAEKLQDAKDEAQRSDQAVEAKEFLRTMTASAVGMDVPNDIALEYFQRAKKYFENQEHDAMEGKN